MRTPLTVLFQAALAALVLTAFTSIPTSRLAAQGAATQGPSAAAAGAVRGGAHGSAPTVRAALLAAGTGDGGAGAAGSIHIDGQLDEAAWGAATPADQLTQRDPDEGRPPTERTEIRVVVGDGALFIAARMFDREPGRIVSRLGRRDERPQSDRLTIRLDARHDHLTAFLFDVFPAGNKGDASVGSDGYEDYSWDPVWDVATRVDSLGWSAELRIPLSQLRYNGASDSWGVQFVRFIQRKQEEDVFAYVPKSENAGVSRYGHLVGMRGLPAARRIEIVPYTSARAQYEDIAAGDPFRDGSDYFGSAGADLKLGLGSDLALDATINPDFGQVEIDPAIVNLSAFETFLPEKRPFFVESADLFRFGQLRTFNSFGTPDVFFSRRIGRQPQGSVDELGADFTDVPEQTTIAAAAKLTGKTRSGWSIAVLDAVTPEEDARYAMSDAVIRHAPVEPLSNYFVGRVRRELREGNTAVGGILTAVNRDLGDPALAALLRSSAYLAGVDFNHSWSERRWALDASFARSALHGSPDAIDRAQRASARYYQRPDATHLDYDPARTSLGGYAAQVAVSKIAGGHWGGNLAYQEKSPGYETNDIGFTQTVGRRGVSTDLHYEETRPGRLLRNYVIGLLSGNDWNYDGNHTTSYVGNITNVRFRNFWTLNTNTFHYFAAYDDQLTRGGPLARVPASTDVNLSLDSDGRGLWAVGVNGSFDWNAAGGWGRTVGGSVALQPGSNVRLAFEPSFTRVHDVLQYVTAVDDPLAAATYGIRTVFATVDRRELALDTRLDWTFTPKLSLQLFVQPLISAGDYSGYKEHAAAGTGDFAVYGRDQGTIARVPRAEGEAALVQVDPDGPGGAAPAFELDDPSFNFRSLRANVVFRWEYRPGSTVYFVWQQARAGEAPIGDFRFRRDFDALLAGPAVNVLAVKLTYWLGM